MHNGIPWWLVLVLEAIHYWWATLGVVALIGGSVWLWWRTKRSG